MIQVIGLGSMMEKYDKVSHIVPMSSRSVRRNEKVLVCYIIGSEANISSSGSSVGEEELSRLVSRGFLQII